MATQTLIHQTSNSLSDVATLEDVIAEVQRRSAVDIAFRKLALTDAPAALALIGEGSIPPEINIQFVDNSGAVKIIPLPEVVPGSEDTDDVLGSSLNGIEGVEVAGWISWSR